MTKVHILPDLRSFWLKNLRQMPSIKNVTTFYQFFYPHSTTRMPILSQIVPSIKFPLHEQHCKPLQGNYRVELVHREIPVVITGNEFTEYSFLLFWLHFFPCFNNIEIVALVPVICTGNCQFILQGFKGCFNTL